MLIFVSFVHQTYFKLFYTDLILQFVGSQLILRELLILFMSAKAMQLVIALAKEE